MCVYMYIHMREREIEIERERETCVYILAMIAVTAMGRHHDVWSGPLETCQISRADDYQ